MGLAAGLSRGWSRPAPACPIRVQYAKRVQPGGEDANACDDVLQRGEFGPAYGCGRPYLRTKIIATLAIAAICCAS